MGKKPRGRTCYMCSNAATSKEHCPPACFFPEKQYVHYERGFRVNLMTVPSCELHNSQKSRDDEFLRMAISTCFVSNDTAVRLIAPVAFRGFFSNHAHEKVRALQQQTIPVSVNGVMTIGFKVPMQRFLNAMNNMGRAIYYYHHRRKLKLSMPLEGYSPSLFDLRGNEIRISEYHQAIKNLSGSFNGLQRYGANPNVFYYQIHEQADDPRVALRMTFYEGFEYVVVSASGIH